MHVLLKRKRECKRLKFSYDNQSIKFNFKLEKKNV